MVESDSIGSDSVVVHAVERQARPNMSGPKTPQLRFVALVSCEARLKVVCLRSMRATKGEVVASTYMLSVGARVEKRRQA
jgi:hypothetical protein